jgi:hypothetical protein
MIMRTSCPDEERIGDYINGRLNENDTSGIEEHLAECEACRQEFIFGKGLIRGGGLELDPVPDEVTVSSLRLAEKAGSIPEMHFNKRWERFFSKARSILDDLLHPALWGRWGLATIRGSRKVVSEDLVHVRRRFGDIETDIEIEKAAGGKAHIRVKLTDTNGDKGDIRVTLKRGEREISSSLPDGKGHVLFEDIPFDHYSLHITRDDTTLGTYPFEIKER